jgi:hypothetical protein
MVQYLQAGQLDKASELLPATIEGALDATPIHMIAKAVDPARVEAFIAYHLTKLAALVNVDQRLNIQPHQVRFIAQALMENFSYESLADINLCLKRGAMGFYGEISRIDAAVITGWMQSYLDEKYDALEQRKAKEKHADKGVDLTKVTKEHVEKFGPGSEYYKEAQRIAAELTSGPEPEKDNRKANEYQRFKHGYQPQLTEEHKRKILKQEFPNATEEQIQELLKKM